MGEVQSFSESQPLTGCERAELARRNRLSMMTGAIAIAITGLLAIPAVASGGTWVVIVLLVVGVGLLLSVFVPLLRGRSPSLEKTLTLRVSARDAFAMAVPVVERLAPFCTNVDAERLVAHGLTRWGRRSIGERLHVEVVRIEIDRVLIQLRSENLLAQHLGSRKAHTKNLEALESGLLAAIQ